MLDVERVIIAFSEADARGAARARSASCASSTCRSTSCRACSRSSGRRPASTRSKGSRSSAFRRPALAVVALPEARARLRRRAVAARPARAAVAVDRALRSASTRAGPVLFRQRRLGTNMRPFTVLKFRTMRVDTDQEEHRRYIADHADARRVAATRTASTSSTAPTSVTRVGRFLRKTSLDELPQLFNVLAGEMSLVGPRPCLDYETRGLRRAPLRALPDAARA